MCQIGLIPLNKQAKAKQGVLNMKAKRRKKVIIAITIAVVSLIFLEYFVMQFTVKSGGACGEIFLYGEKHSVEDILEKEFELWSSYYQNDGVRDLFVELPYYTAAYMNLWIKSDGDDINSPSRTGCHRKTSGKGSITINIPITHTAKIQWLKTLSGNLTV